MATLHLHTPWASDITLVPNHFLDEHMLQANGEFVKIYLYLLRCAPDSLPSLSLLADKMSCTERDILRAVRYWEKEGLLKLGLDDEKKISDISFVYPKSSPAEDLQPAAPVPPKTQPEEKTAPTPVPAPPPSQPEDKLSADRVRKLKENEEIVQLLYIAEQYLGRTLTFTDTNKLLYFYEKLKFDAELIEYLIEYCVSKDHRSIRYIERVALSWAEQGISTVTAAKEEARQYSQTYFTIFKALGIQNRNPVKAEIEMMDRWMQEWGFTMDLIQEACRRTVMQTGSGSFPYTDSILQKWHTDKVRHLVDLEATDARHKAKTAGAAQKGKKKKDGAAPNRFNDYPHRDYDFDQIKRSMFEQ